MIQNQRLEKERMSINSKIVWYQSKRAKSCVARCLEPHNLAFDRCPPLASAKIRGTDMVSIILDRSMRPTQASFPATRLRRTRQSPAIRGLVRQNTLTREDLIWPIFVRSGKNIEEPIPSMPGVMRRSVDKVVEAAREAADLGIPAICIFPIHWNRRAHRRVHRRMGSRKPRQSRHSRNQGGGA